MFKKSIFLLTASSFIQCASEEIATQEEKMENLPLAQFEENPEIKAFYGFNIYERSFRQDYKEYVKDLSFLGDMKPNIIIEVGSFLGGSTIRLAEFLPENGKLYAVDTFLGSPELIPLTGNEWSAEPYQKHQTDYDVLFLQFMANMREKNLHKKVIPIRNTSINAAAYFEKSGVKADLIYIDGAHEKIPVLEDVCLYYNLLEVGGIFFGDDLGGSFKGVEEALELFSKKYAIPYKSVKGKWVIQKEKDIRTSLDDFFH